MLNTLDENPGRWDLSSLEVVVSSGVMCNRDLKKMFRAPNGKADSRNGG